MERILGYFLFLALGDGTLASKFGHTETDRLLSETATLLGGASPPNLFIGDYASVWLDAVGPGPVNHTQGFLRIFSKPNSLVDQYWLEWRQIENGRVIYWGEGMVHNNVLIGAYWGSQVNQALPSPHQTSPRLS